MFSTQTMPSWLATCASHGPPITSPMAYSPSTLVRYMLSTLIAPRSYSTPTSSRPKPSTLPTTPTAERTCAAWSVSVPFLVSTVTMQPSPDVSTFVTWAPVMTLTPIFL